MVAYHVTLAKHVLF